MGKLLVRHASGGATPATSSLKLTMPVRDHYTPREEKLLDITIAEGEPEIQPDGVGDDLLREEDVVVPEVSHTHLRVVSSPPQVDNAVLTANLDTIARTTATR